MHAPPGPGSITWLINRESALLLGGGRALLMQVAHPLVAAGVAEHSDFRSDPLARLRRTMELSLSLTFGTRAEVRIAARRINRTHERIRGTGYRALEPELLLWVHATLIDSALLTYRTFVGSLTAVEMETYYQEAKPIGGMLGIPPRRYPRRLADLEAYLAEMLAGPVQPDETGRRLASLVLRPPIRRVPSALFLPFEVITAGLLPEQLRRAYGLRWGASDRTFFSVARTALSRVLATLPRGIRIVPAARIAEGSRPTASQRTN